MTRAPSTRFLLTVAVFVPVLAVSVALTWLVLNTSRGVEQSLGDSLMRDTTSALRQEVIYHLRDAVRVSDLYDMRVRQGTLDIAKPFAWERPIYDSLLYRPNVASICFANVRGEAIYVLRSGDDLIAGRARGTGTNQTAEYVIDDNGKPAAEPRRVYAYDAQRRPWYQLALLGNKPVWTPAYFWYSDNPGLAPPVGSIGYARPVYDAKAQLQGCMVVDVTLDSISDMLHRTPLNGRAAFFILDDNENVIASSIDPKNNHLPEDRLLRLDDFHDPDSKAAAAELGRMPESARRTTGVTDVYVEGEAARLMVEPLGPFHGLKWRLVAVVRDSAYLSQTGMLRSQAVGIAVACAGVALLFGLVIARRFSQPIAKLAGHVRRATEGDVTEDIDIRSTREFQSLSQAVNQMTHGMREQVRLRAATEAAESANRTKTAFFTRVTHELRTPLNAIIGFSEMMEERTEIDRDREDLAKILRASNQLLRLINDLLDLAKIEAGKSDVRVSDFSVARVVEEAVVMVEPIARAQRNTLHVPRAGSDYSMRSDPDKLRQILLNLLANAAKYTHGGAITLTFSCVSEWMMFRVDDTGPGILPEALDRLFEPFTQNSAAGNPQAGGTGLGLTICRQYARALGGDISVESEPGNGAQFTLALPRSVGTTAESPELGSGASWLFDHSQGA